MTSFYWQTIDAGAALLAAATTLAGLFLVYHAWRHRSRWLTPGWVIIALSCWPWVAAAGADVGISLALVVLMLGAIAVVAVTGQWQRNGNPRRQRVPLDDAERDPSATAREHRHRLRRALVRLLAAGPLSAGAALTLVMLLAAYAAWPESDRLVTAAMLAPLLWGLGMAWSCADSRPLRPVAALAVLTFLPLPLLPLW